MAESNNTDWRELCTAASNEPDPEKFATLIERIIDALDERSKRFMKSEPLEQCRG
jgi:hypothetical protein